MMPSRYLPHLFALALAPALVACVAAPVLPGSYPLRPQQSATLARDLTITYDSFSDSRCPPNAQCIWAGRLVFRFIIDGRGGVQEITLGPDHPSARPPILRGATIALDMATIPPARAVGTMRPSDAMPVTLKVTPP
jgi:hypothetical protein